MRTAAAKMKTQKTLKLDPGTARKLEEFAFKHKVTQTLVVEKALRAYFKAKEI